jgi:hypothetical protein
LELSVVVIVPFNVKWIAFGMMIGKKRKEKKNE